MHFNTSACFIFPILFSTLLLSPDSLLYADDPDRERLETAFRSFESQTLTFRGSIEEVDTNSANSNAQPQIVFANGASGFQDFAGSFELSIQSNKDYAILSDSELPSVKIYKCEKGILCEQTHLGPPYDPEKICSLVEPLSDWKEIAKRISSSSRVRTNLVDSKTIFRVAIDPSLLNAAREVQLGQKAAPAIGGGGAIVRMAVNAGPMTAKVIDLTMVVVMDQTEKIISIDYEAQYNDPMKALMARAINIAPAIPGGGGPAVFRMQEKGEGTGGEESIGKLLKFHFQLSSVQSPKTLEFIARSQMLLSANE